MSVAVMRNDSDGEADADGVDGMMHGCMDAAVTDTGSPFGSARPILAGPSESPAAPLQIHRRETRQTSRSDIIVEAGVVDSRKIMDPA